MNIILLPRYEIYSKPALFFSVSIVYFKTLVSILIFHENERNGGNRRKEEFWGIDYFVLWIRVFVIWYKQKIDTFKMKNGEVFFFLKLLVRHFFFSIRCKRLLILSIPLLVTIMLIVPPFKMCRDAWMKNGKWMAGFHLYWVIESL